MKRLQCSSLCIINQQSLPSCLFSSTPRQGKRVAGEDGSEGFSDLFQENAMLQRENDNLRMRVKAMQETIDHLNTRVTQLLTNEINLLLTKTGTPYNSTSCHTFP